MIDNFDTSADVDNSTNNGNKASKTAKIDQSAELSVKETREILTPLAFKIDQSLFGIALAKPWRRGLALLVDLCFVAILSGAPGELLAVLVAVTFFNIGSKKGIKKPTRLARMRKSLTRLLGALIVFIVLIDVFPQLFTELDNFEHHVDQAGQNTVSDKKDNSSDNNNFIKGTVSLAANLAISNSDCEQYSCWQLLSTNLFEAFSEQSFSRVEVEQFNANVTELIAEKSTLAPDKLTQLAGHLKQLHSAKTATLSNMENTTDVNLKYVNMDEPSLEILIDEGTLQAFNPVKSANTELADRSVYKGFAWLKGLIEDLGIGFGWAAFYFTMFTALWHGQTLGKKLLRIRVLQLDGTPLSVWDSFGRYGGYGAGIATGFLGFAQIYWDPNRQAIHDKISATIVVNENAAKVPKSSG